MLNDLKDESLGMYSQPFKPGSFALTAREGHAAPELRRALLRISSVLNLLQDDMIFSLQINGDEAGLHMQTVDPVRGTSVFAQGTMVRVFWRLPTSRLSPVQLASELGFSDSPTFQRAFKHWTGQHCGAYRR